MLHVGPYVFEVNSIFDFSVVFLSKSQRLYIYNLHDDSACCGKQKSLQAGRSK